MVHIDNGILFNTKKNELSKKGKACREFKSMLLSEVSESEKALCWMT